MAKQTYIVDFTQLKFNNLRNFFIKHPFAVMNPITVLKEPKSQTISSVNINICPGSSKKLSDFACHCSSLTAPAAPLQSIGGVFRYIFYDLRGTSASLESVICPSAEPLLCITPPGKEMKASPCHSVVSPRLMGSVARDLHSVGGLSVCVGCIRIGSVSMCVSCIRIHSN